MEKKSTTSKSNTSAKTKKKKAEVFQGEAMQMATMETPVVTNKPKASKLKSEKVRLQRVSPYTITLPDKAKYAVIKNEGGGDVIIMDSANTVLYMGDTEKVEGNTVVYSYSYPSISITYWG